MNSGLIPGLIAGPNRLSKAVLSRKQAIPNAEITQALANLGIARASLSAPVTRTSATGTTLTNTNLETLTVSLLPSSRYRLTYRLYFSGLYGAQIGFTYPTSLPQMDASLQSWDAPQGAQFIGVPNWPTSNVPSGSPIYDSQSDIVALAYMTFITDILTGSTANTFGDFAVLFAQSTSNATASTMSKNSCVEVLKY